jgi:hypothetical protein
MRLLISVLGVIAFLALGVRYVVQDRRPASLVAFLFALVWPLLAATKVSSALEDRLAGNGRIEDESEDSSGDG